MLFIEGFCMIFDAKFALIYWQEKTLKEKLIHELPLYVLYYQVPLNILGDLLEQCQRDISDVTANLFQLQKVTADLFTEIKQIYVKTVNTSSDWQLELYF